MDAQDLINQPVPKRNRTEVLTHIAVLCPDWYTDDITDIQYLEGGYSNRNFAFSHDAQRYVIRIPERSQPYVDRYAEAAWYGRLPDHFHKPIAFDNESGRMISHWVQGELLVDSDTSRDPVVLAAYLHQLHADLPTCDRDYDVAAMLECYDYDRGSDYGEDQTATLTRSCHNDLNPWNIIVTESGWVTLDWEFAGNNDPLFDLVALHQGLRLPPDQLALMSQLYLGRFEPDRLDHVLRAYWLREAGWAHYQMGHGNHRREVVDQLQTAEAALRVL